MRDLVAKAQRRRCLIGLEAAKAVLKVALIPGAKAVVHCQIVVTQDVLEEMG